jgi:hypothetical protein
MDLFTGEAGGGDAQSTRVARETSFPRQLTQRLRFRDAEARPKEFNSHHETYSPPGVAGRAQPSPLAGEGGAQRRMGKPEGGDAQSK